MDTFLIDVCKLMANAIPSNYSSVKFWFIKKFKSKTIKLGHAIIVFSIASPSSSLNSFYSFMERLQTFLYSDSYFKIFNDSFGLRLLNWIFKAK